MDRLLRPRSDLATGLQLFVIVFVAYAVGAEAAFRLAEESGLQAVFFIPAGVTAGTLLLTGRERWPWILAAAATAELAQDLRADIALPTSLGFVAANVVEPLLGVLLVRGITGRAVDLSFRRHTSAFLACNVAGAPFVGALVGATVAELSDADTELLETFAQWWLGDALGVLLVATLIIVWRGAPDRNRLFGWRGLTLIGMSATGTAVVMLASDLPLMFLVLTGVVVAGAQFGVRAVAITTATVAVVIAVTMLFEDGSLLAGTSNAVGVIIVKLKLLVFMSGGLVVASEVIERERLTEAATRLRAEAAAEHAIVNRLQRLLLPPERIGGRHHTAFGSYSAGTGALGVGGDWYDVAALPDGRVFVTVGDVVGRGASAAAVMARLRAVMLVLAPRADDAGALLGQLDRHIHQMIDALGTTAWAGLYDPEREQLSYASCGHLPGFLIRHDGDVVRLDHQVAAPLGVDPTGVKPSSVVDVPGGATLVLYTDGLIERRGETIDVSIDRLHARIQAVRALRTDPERLVDSLVPEAHDDDTVLLAVSLRPA